MNDPSPVLVKTIKKRLDRRFLARCWRAALTAVREEIDASDSDRRACAAGPYGHGSASEGDAEDFAIGVHLRVLRIFEPLVAHAVGLIVSEDAALSLDTPQSAGEESWQFSQLQRTIRSYLAALRAVTHPRAGENTGYAWSERGRLELEIARLVAFKDDGRPFAPGAFDA